MFLILSLVETAANPVALTPDVNTCSWSAAFLNSSLFVTEPITPLSLSASPSQYDDSLIFVFLFRNAVSWFRSFSRLRSMFTLMGLLSAISLACETARLTCAPSLSLLPLTLSCMSLADTFLSALLISRFNCLLSILACNLTCLSCASSSLTVWLISVLVFPFVRTPTSLILLMTFSNSLMSLLTCTRLFCCCSIATKLTTNSLLLLLNICFLLKF